VIQAHERLNQEDDDDEDFSSTKNNIDIHTPSSNSPIKAHVEAGKDLVTAPLKKTT
jgi:hypothetical protein